MLFFRQIITFVPPYMEFPSRSLKDENEKDSALIVHHITYYLLKYFLDFPNRFDLLPQSVVVTNEVFPAQRVSRARAGV